MQDLIGTIVALGLGIFLVRLLTVVQRHAKKLFWDPHGWSHRFMGAWELMWLCLGLGWWGVLASSAPDDSRLIFRNNSLSCFLYDAILGILGCLLTYTASRDFPHRYVSRTHEVSGTLAATAMVTQDEMVEHLFYQGLNLVQAVYLHAIPYCVEKTTTGDISDSSNTLARASITPRSLLLLMVTAPWWVRRRFPVHSFSQNWKRKEGQRNESQHANSALEICLYRIKKYQYMFYKHVVLHGLNLTLFVQDRPRAVMLEPSFRLFWLLLNASYVMEFFLQSLVRRKVLQQSNMLLLNRFLMVLASVQGALCLGGLVNPVLCVLSLIGNLVHRGYDVTNTLVLASWAWVYY